MQQDLYPVRLINPMPGKSSPQLIEFSNNGCYVVKFKNSKHGTRALVNEYVVAKLAEILAFPVVPTRIVYMTKAFIENQSKLQRHGFTEGNQFASLFIPNAKGLPKNDDDFPGREEVKNAADAAGILVFDHWVNNLDRGSQNILLQSLPDNSYQVYMIDHGKCFPGGFYWTTKTLKKEPKKVLKKKSNLWCASLLDSPDEMTPYIDRIINIPEERIFEIVNKIPEDWQVSDAEKTALSDYLIRSRMVLSKLMDRFITKVRIGKPFIKKKQKKK